MAIDQNATTAEASPNFLSDFSGMFDFLMDPGGAAKRLPRKFFWIAPLILVSVIFMACGFLNLPLIQQAMMNQPPPPNANPLTAAMIGFPISRTWSHDARKSSM